MEVVEIQTPSFMTNEYFESYEQWAYYMQQREAFNHAHSLKEKVKKRDNFACQHCGRSEGVTLCVHHKNGLRAFPMQALCMDNLVTLCWDCHTEFHKIYGYGQNTIVTEEQFEEWQLLACGVKPHELPNKELQPKQMAMKIYLPSEEELEAEKERVAKRLEELNKQAKNEEFLYSIAELREIDRQQQFPEERKEKQRHRRSIGTKVKDGKKKCEHCGRMVITYGFAFDKETCTRSNICMQCEKHMH